MAWEGLMSFNESVTASGNGSAIHVGSPTQYIDVEIEVTNVSGTTPTLDIAIQESDDGVTFSDIVSLPQITSNHRRVYAVRTEKPYLRYSKTVGGTTPIFGLEVRIR